MIGPVELFLPGFAESQPSLVESSEQLAVAAATPTPSNTAPPIASGMAAKMSGFGPLRAGTARASFGTELGFWVLPDLRVGGGYNWTGVVEPGLSPLLSARRGFYLTISSKLSNLFDLFGTPRQNAQGQGDSKGDAANAAGQKHEDE